MLCSTTPGNTSRNPATQQALVELLRSGVEQLVMAALELEADQYLASTSHLRDQRGHALTVRNGRHKPRSIPSCVGPLTIRAPRVHDRRPQHAFVSHILPPYVRGLRAWRETLPLYYLSGMLHGSFGPVVQALLDSHGMALSPQRALELTTSLHEAWRIRFTHSLEPRNWAKVWIEPVALSPAGACEHWPPCLVAAGVNRTGVVGILAIAPDSGDENTVVAALRESLAARGMLIPRQVGL